MSLSKNTRRDKIRKRIRAKVSGNSSMPRLSVFRSSKGISAQLIDDVASRTLVAVSSLDKGIILQGNTKTQVSAQVGKLLAQKALEIGLSACAFDRGGYQYHGRVKALAEGAREEGLTF